MALTAEVFMDIGSLHAEQVSKEQVTSIYTYTHTHMHMHSHTCTYTHALTHMHTQ